MIKRKLFLITLLVLAVFTVGIITGCSSGKNSGGGSGDDDGGNVNPNMHLVVFDNLGGMYTQHSTWADTHLGDTSDQIFYPASGPVFAWFLSEVISDTPDVWGMVELKLLKDKKFFFQVKTFDSETETLGDDFITSGFDITVDPANLATVDVTNCSITATEVGTGTLTFEYGDFSHEVVFTVVEDTSGLPSRP